MIKKYCGTESYKLFHGNMLEMADAIENRNSVDAIVCDPPYELNFMGKGWDNAGISFNPDTWKKCYDVLKPGGYLLAFGGSRTFHRIACAIEDAGFEIRDTIMWLYGSGFPKSMNIGLAIDKKNGVDNKTGKIRTDGKATSPDSKVYNCNDNDKPTSKLEKVFEERVAQNEWAGWGTALKPAYEPIIVARKPFKGSCVDNVMKYGVGGINIDECRVEISGEKVLSHNAPKGTFAGGEYDRGSDTTEYREQTGRFPANVIHDGSEEVCANMPESNGAGGSIPKVKVTGYGTQIGQGSYEYYGGDRTMFNSGSGSVSRYFYCAKASKKDRDEGLDDFEEKSAGYRTNRKDGSAGITAYAGATGKAKNIHPTVKPTSLMQYLVRLVTPRGGVVLDPFMGSGSTGKAVMYENNERNAEYKFIGIELTDEYLPIAQARIQAAKEAK